MTKPLKAHTLQLAAVLILALPISGTGIAGAQAQQVTTTVAGGSDFWTGSMDPSLFQLHQNGGTQACAGTEKFVTVRGSLGYCIDANENAAGNLEWEDARETCAAAGKRLPEPAEYKFACQAGISGLNGMTDNFEWATNFAGFFRNPSSPFVFFIPATTMGSGSCFASSAGNVASSTPASSTAPFRCVH